MKAWGSRLAKQGVLDPDTVDWVVEPKVDGLAVRIVFRCVAACGLSPQCMYTRIRGA